MKTELGRVVYDRAKNVMKPADIVRIIDSYSPGTSGREFGKFLLEIVKKVLARNNKPEIFRQDAEVYIIETLIEAHTWDLPIRNLMEILSEKFGGAVSLGVQARTTPVQEPVPETMLEKKRRIARGGM